MAGSAVIRSIAAAALALLGGTGSAADAPAALVGTYSGSQMEVGTELRLEANGRFQYYLSYGALDETAQGTWTADGGGLVLTSDPVKEPVFELVGMTSGKGRKLAITLDVPQQLPKQLFSVFALQPDGTAQEMNFDEGPLELPLTADKRPRKIAVALSIFQVASRPYDIAPGTRSMHFRFIPNDLGKVNFDHHRLPRDGNAFVLERFDRTLRYVKEAPEESAERQNAAAN
jgi:hypothetical protein